MKQSKYEITREKYLSEDEQGQLVKILNRHKDKEPRNVAIIWLALHTGARATELLNLKITDFDVDKQSVYVCGIKNSKDREIPIPEWLFKIVLSLKTHKDGHIFPISYPRLNQIWTHYKPVKKKFHSLRHTFALNLYDKCKDIKVLQMALGHRSLMNTMIYADFRYNTEELRRVLFS